MVVGEVFLCQSFLRIAQHLRPLALEAILAVLGLHLQLSVVAVRIRQVVDIAVVAPC